MAQQIKITQTSNADMNIGVPKTQTAVEWLIEQLEQQVYTIDHKDNRVIPKSFDDIIEIKKQAKQMEKEQIINAFNYRANMKWGSESQINTGEQYYNETYGSNNQI